MLMSLLACVAILFSGDLWVLQVTRASNKRPVTGRIAPEVQNEPLGPKQVAFSASQCLLSPVTPA